jgi:hypothetical protein
MWYASLVVLEMRSLVRDDTMCPIPNVTNTRTAAVIVMTRVIELCPPLSSCGSGDRCRITTALGGAVECTVVGVAVGVMDGEVVVGGDAVGNDVGATVCEDITGGVIGDFVVSLVQPTMTTSATKSPVSPHALPLNALVEIVMTELGIVISTSMALP